MVLIISYNYSLQRPLKQKKKEKKNIIDAHINTDSETLAAKNTVKQILLN